MTLGRLARFRARNFRLDPRHRATAWSAGFSRHAGRRPARCVGLIGREARTAWNAGFSRHSPPKAGGETDLIRRDGVVVRQCVRGSDEPPAALRSVVGMP